MTGCKSVYKTNEGRDAVLSAYDGFLAKWPVPYEEIFVDTNFGRTYVIKCGNDALPPLVLLHGTSSNSSMWLGDVARYAELYCIYAVDIPGEPGKSAERQYPLKGTVYCDWLDEVIQGLLLSKASFLGISLGAWIAAGYAAKYTEKVEKLVLLCPSGIGPQRISFIFKVIPLMLLGDKGFDKIAGLVNGSQPIPEEALEYTKLIARNFNLRTEQVPIFSDEDLKKLTMPVLLFAGEKDVLLHSVKTVRRMKALLPQVDANLLPEHGHVLIGLTEEIVHFLSKAA